MCVVTALVHLVFAKYLSSATFVVIPTLKELANYLHSLTLVSIVSRSMALFGVRRVLVILPGPYVGFSLLPRFYGMYVLVRSARRRGC